MAPARAKTGICPTVPKDRELASSFILSNHGRNHARRLEPNAHEALMKDRIQRFGSGATMSSLPKKY